MASFRTITARFAGQCRRCKGAIKAGERIRYGGRGLTYHFANDCAGKPADDGEERGEDSRDGGEFVPCWKGGRCEDYPCCGCHGLHGRDLYTPSEPPDVDF